MTACRGANTLNSSVLSHRSVVSLVHEASLFVNLSFVAYENGEGACPVYHALLLLRLRFDVSIYIRKLGFVNHSDL